MGLEMTDRRNTAAVITSCLIVSFGKASIADSNVSNQALLTTIKNKDIVADCVLDMQKYAYFTTIQKLGLCKIKSNFKQCF